MTERLACHLFKQTRVNLDWAEKKSTSIIDVPLPHHAGRISKSLAFPKKSNRLEQPADTEEKFKLTHHASSASIHCRPVARFPRCILWRIVEDWHVLSLTAVDFTKPESSSELETTFRFVFPEPIQTGTVGFADAPGRDELVVYALTQSGVLYTLNLTPDFLLRNSFLRRNSESSDYCTTFYPTAFSLHSPHFLLALDHESLIIPLQDGNILKLVRGHRTGTGGEYMSHRNASHLLTSQVLDPTVASYNEQTFSDSGYFGYLKNKMPWVGASTVPYGQSAVTHTTVVSALAYGPSHSPANKRRPEISPLLFTVSVDHSLKIWSLENDSLVRALDLLNEPQAMAPKIRTWLDPSPSHLLAIIDQSFQEDHSFYLVSFSSAATGKFKFWAATHYDDGQFKDLVDLYPETTFDANPPSASAPWIISEFRVTPSPSNRPGMFDLWVLWKSDTNFQVQNALLDIKDVKTSWEQWSTATSDTLHNLPKRTPSSETSEDVSDHWMNWVFYPGRFPDTVLESALRIYENNFLAATGASAHSETIQAKVARTVAAAVRVDKSSTGLADYEKFRNETDLQWDRFSRLCMELDKARREALSLVSDPATGFVWTVNVDGITAMRECTENEMIWHNFSTREHTLDILSKRNPRQQGARLGGPALADAMALVYAATELRDSLSEEAIDKCLLSLRKEIVKDELYSVGDLMWTIYEECLDNEVPDEIYDKLEIIFQLIQDPETAFQSLMSSLCGSLARPGTSRLTAFGCKVIAGGAQEVVHVNNKLFFSLILLLVYITLADDDARRFSKLSRPEELYHQLLSCFREYEVLAWMAKNPVSLSTRPVSSADDISQALTDLRVSEDRGSRLAKKGSVLQLMLPDNVGPSPPGYERNSADSLSVCIMQFLYDLQLSPQQNGAISIASTLLDASAPSLAAEFSEFLPSTCWGTYMKGRIQLKAHNHALAAISFNKAAYGMCMCALCWYLVSSR
jgi:nuclear pore complex protein Nup160